MGPYKVGQYFLLWVISQWSVPILHRLTMEGTTTFGPCSIALKYELLWALLYISIIAIDQLNSWRRSPLRTIRSCFLMLDSMMVCQRWHVAAGACWWHCWLNVDNLVSRDMRWQLGWLGRSLGRLVDEVWLVILSSGECVVRWDKRTIYIGVASGWTVAESRWTM